MLRPLLRAAVLGFLAISLAVPARATWSIVVLNRVTGEVAVATSTCIANFDIADAVPVIRVGYGAGAAQAFVLSQPRNRRIIFRNSLRGATPQQMLDEIERTDGGFQNRQFGIVAFAGPPVTHSGTSNGVYAGGLVGQIGPYDYAIQGNVLTGANVVLDCEAAFLATQGDLGQRMMAAMEAARDAGGDGRCSCNVSFPTSCGSPPPSFTYASYNAFFAIARPGDTDAPCLASTGCAAGDYYLRTTYVGNNTSQEPIAALRAQFDTWRAALGGRPDHVRSEVVASVPRLRADGITTSRVTVRLRDLDGVALTQGGQALAVVLENGDAIANVQGLVDNGDGTHGFDLVSSGLVGSATFTITVDDGIRPVQLYPSLAVTAAAPTELHIGTETYSASEGTTVPLIVDRGPSDAGATYRILGSFAGTTPGTTVGGVGVPLNRDRFFDVTLSWMGAAPFTGNFGLLDGSGRAEASFFPPPGGLSGLVGSTLSFSALIGGQDATAPASIMIGS